MFGIGNPDDMNRTAKAPALERVDSIDGNDIAQITSLPDLLGHSRGIAAFFTGESSAHAEILGELKHPADGTKMLIQRRDDGSIAGFAAVENKGRGPFVRVMQGSPEMLAPLVQAIRAYAQDKGAVTVFVDADVAGTASTLADAGFSEITSTEAGKRAFKSAP